MSYGSRQRSPESRTAQPGSRPAAPTRTPARGRRASRPGLFHCQAYRYFEQAQQLKHPVPVGDAKVSFTVKLSRSLVDRLRDYAASTGLTLSEIANRAFSGVLHRGGGRG